MILGVTGTNGAGKGTVVEYLKEKGFTHYSVRSELEADLERRNLPIDRPHLGALGNELRAQYGAGYFIDVFVKRAEKGGVIQIAVESIRSIGEARALHEHGGLLLAVDADLKLRYQRIIGRGLGTDKVDFDTWVAQEEKEWHNTAAYDMNVPVVMQMADYTITNDGTLEELHAQIDDVLAKIGK